ncbi:MAG TPA: DUF4097 family beta strand repeat-containing protein [Pseudolysinimonas sp.]|jgi:DUF4097 and DUF4098 domain-containing protein YvlB|nr:DUF4097 family beta strand repeat-containing protein [Pseudolysinimonas sp.]
MAQEKWLVDGPKTIDIESARTLKVGLIGGQVDIVAHDEPGVRVEVHSVSGKDLKISVDGDQVEIDHPQLSWDNWLDVFKSWSGRARADVSVMVPRDIRVKLGVVSATALLSGTAQQASLSTVSGDLVIDGVTADLTINSVSGEVTVRNHEGRIGVNTVSGDITASGELRGFAADSVSGAVMIDASEIPDDIKVNTVSGAVTVRLDADTPTSYSLNTVGGRLQVGDNSITGVKGRFAGKWGDLDKRWTDLRVNTVGGDINVLRAVRAS